jgi:alpha-ketoglutarate-dependent 2,4-dichlorophenoxyacetate dioxygenase
MIVDARSSGFGATISGVTVRGGLADGDIEAIRAALDRYGVLVLHDQTFTDEEQLAFCERFGTVEHNPSDRRKRLGVAGMTDVSNINDDDEIFARDDERHLFSLANQLWHTDSSFKPVPACYSMLSCREATSSGGETEFADMRAAYDALQPETRSLVADLVTEHAFIHSRRMLGFEGSAPRVEAMPGARRPIVHVHAGSGRTSLYLASHALRIVGWPVPEGRLLLAELTEHATQAAFVYRHQWRRGDFVLWDNRCTMHRGLRYPTGERRDMRRTTTRDDVHSSLIVPVHEPVEAI